MFAPMAPQLERERLRLELERIEKHAAHWAGVEREPRNYRRMLSKLRFLAIIFKI
jgi:hypothetical protein